MGRASDAPLTLHCFLPAAVSHFDELEDILGAFDLPLLQPDHLHLLLAILQDAELRFAVKQVKHLQMQIQCSLIEPLR